MQAAETLRAVGEGFEVIYADPAWNFTSNSTRNPGKNARRHYDCMSLQEIKDLPVREIAAKDALLLLWVTVPFYDKAREVVDAWGFKYVSEVVWVKSRIGTGFWARNRHEPLLICKRGKFPCPKPAMFSDSVIQAPTREHSRKPDEFYDIIEAPFPDARKLEMFARQERPGWTVWGNETEKFTPKPKRSVADLLGFDPLEDDPLLA